jgi:predicted outer membrane protein
MSFGLLASGAGTAPTDPQIVGIVTANQIDIDAGQLALKRAKGQQRQDFAQQTVRDHTALKNYIEHEAAYPKRSLTGLRPYRSLMHKMRNSIAL